jgi:hypothetical protein
MVIFAKSKFLHPIQELDKDLIFLILLPSGVEEGINWMLHRGIAPVLSPQERNLCNDLKLKANLKLCHCHDDMLEHCRCAIPFGDILVYAVLVFSYQMHLHSAGGDLKKVFKEWLMCQWDSERTRICESITDDEYA